MKLQQYINSFIEPLAASDARQLLRLLALRNKTARGLSDTVGAIDVSEVAVVWLHTRRSRRIVIQKLGL